MDARNLVLSKTLLRYGKITLKEDYESDEGNITIRIIKYEGATYWHKMVNGIVTDINKWS